jgi:UDP-GlcNAc:undecaprenyl-phosphate/decaprenyl-phosphate GlcNAc-1-phosphate transferase
MIMVPSCAGNFGARYIGVLFLFCASLFTVLHPVPFLNFHSRSWSLVLLSFSIAYLLTPLACALAARLNMVDIPNDRKVHAEATPLLGGLPIFLAFSLSTASILWYSLELKGVIYAATLVFIVGLLDDRYNLSSLVRLFAQLAAVCILFLHGMEIEFVPDFTQWHIFKKLVTILWIIGITNAVNFLDGLDGLCVGYGAISALFMGGIAFLTHQYFLMFLALSLAGSCFGFLPWNFRRREPARIFMGDAGSLFIGFTLAALSIMGVWAENRTVALAVPVLILFLPIFDISMTTFFRIREGSVRTFRQWLDYAGKDHIHHRVYATGIGKRNAVYVLYAVAVMLGFSAVIIRTGGPLEAYLALLQAAVVLAFFVGFLMYIKNRYDVISHLTERMVERSAIADERAEADSA